VLDEREGKRPPRPDRPGRPGARLVFWFERVRATECDDEVLSDDDRVGRAKRTERRREKDGGRARAHARTPSGDDDDDDDDVEREEGAERWRTLWRRNEDGWRRKTR
jgi:hypothetical protein